MQLGGIERRQRWQECDVPRGRGRMAAGIAEQVSERTAAAAVGVVCPSFVTDNVVINARWTGRVLGVGAEAGAS